MSVLLATDILHTTAGLTLQPKSVKELKGPNPTCEFLLIGTNVVGVGIIRLNNFDNTKSLAWGGVLST